MLARQASKTLKELSAAQQLEFDFFGGGNVHRIPVSGRRDRTPVRSGKDHRAGQRSPVDPLTICRHLGWQTYECTKTAADLCEITRTKAPNMADALKLLEQVGAIHRVKRGRVKIITVTPEGAFRGNVNNHAQAVERYKLDVIEGGKSGNPEESS